MKTYCVYFTCRAYVEADNRDDAIAIAGDRRTELVEWDVERVEECE
jgi:hypothetical protein